MPPVRWHHPETSGEPATDQMHLSATVFYSYEAELLDHWMIDSWLEHVAPDFVYRVPVPLVTDQTGQLGYDTRSLLMDEDRDSIADNWAARMTDEHNPVSWADNPPVRLLRSVSAVRVRHMSTDDMYLVRSNVRIEMVRQSGEPKGMSCERFDVLRSVDGGFSICSRFAVLTSKIIDAPRPRIIF